MIESQLFLVQINRRRSPSARHLPISDTSKNDTCRDPSIILYSTKDHSNCRDPSIILQGMDKITRIGKF